MSAHKRGDFYLEPEKDMKLGPVKTIHYCDGSWAIGSIQALYLDRQTRRLIPNVSFVRPDGSIFFEVNEIGLKGDPVDLTRKLAVVWGDSVVFGIGPSWPYLLDPFVPGYQFLNGGIEGDDYRNVLRRMIELNRERPVGINILFPGWHPHGLNQELGADLRAACREVPEPVLSPCRQLSTVRSSMKISLRISAPN
jgi:hypothetical protein